MKNKIFFFTINLMVASLLTSQTSFSSCNITNRTGWDISGAFLYWYSHEQGIGYTNRPADVLTTDDFTQNSVINPSFDWEPGLRIGTGYTKRDCKWTFQGYWTYLKSRATGNKSVNSGAPDFLGMYPVWSMGPDTLEGDYVSSASLKWRLYTNLVDLYAQYNYSCFSDRLSLMPFLGVRGAFLNQKLKAKYEGGTFFTGVDVNTLRSRYFSGGPRLGLNADCNLIYGISVLGRAAVAPLFGVIHIKQKETYLGDNRFHRSTEHYHFILSTDYEAGLKWKGAAFEDRLYVTLGVAWEGQEFFYANSFYRGPHHFFNENRHLFLRGLTFTGTLDF